MANSILVEQYSECLCPCHSWIQSSNLVAASHRVSVFDDGKSGNLDNFRSDLAFSLFSNQTEAIVSKFSLPPVLITG